MALQMWLFCITSPWFISRPRPISCMLLGFFRCPTSRYWRIQSLPFDIQVAYQKHGEFIFEQPCSSRPNPKRQEIIYAVFTPTKLLERVEKEGESDSYCTTESREGGDGIDFALRLPKARYFKTLSVK